MHLPVLENMSSELPSQERQENDGELSDLKEKSKV
jgi:hypothetical protein